MSDSSPWRARAHGDMQFLEPCVTACIERSPWRADGPDRSYWRTSCRTFRSSRARHLGLSARVFEAGREHIHLVGIEVAIPIKRELGALVTELRLNSLYRRTVGDEQHHAGMA